MSRLVCTQFSAYFIEEFADIYRNRNLIMYCSSRQDVHHTVLVYGGDTRLRRHGVNKRRSECKFIYLLAKDMRLNYRAELGTTLLHEALMIVTDGSQVYTDNHEYYIIPNVQPLSQSVQLFSVKSSLCRLQSTACLNSTAGTRLTREQRTVP